MTDIEKCKKIVPLLEFLEPNRLAETLKDFVEIYEAHKKLTVPFNDGDFVTIRKKWKASENSMFTVLKAGDNMIVDDIHWSNGEWSCSIATHKDSQTWFSFKVKDLVLFKKPKTKKKKND